MQQNITTNKRLIIAILLGIAVVVLFGFLLLRNQSDSKIAEPNREPTLANTLAVIKNSAELDKLLDNQDLSDNLRISLKNYIVEDLKRDVNETPFTVNKVTKNNDTITVEGELQSVGKTTLVVTLLPNFQLGLKILDESGSTIYDNRASGADKTTLFITKLPIDKPGYNIEYDTESQLITVRISKGYPNAQKEVEALLQKEGVDTSRVTYIYQGVN